jgi:hypothetical protein
LAVEHSKTAPELLQQLRELSLVLIVWSAEGSVFEASDALPLNYSPALDSDTFGGLVATALRLAETLRIDPADSAKEVQ